MILLHLASLRSGKHFIAVCAFLLLMICVAMAYAGWFDSSTDIMHSGWFLLLIWQYASMCAIINHDNGTSEFFLALGKIQKWSWAAILVHFIVSSLFVAVWTILTSMMDTFNPVISAAMLLFCAVFSPSTLGNLNTKLIGQSKKLAIITVISAPWTLTSWILGLYASNQAMNGESYCLFLLAISLIALFQIVLTLLPNHETAQRRQKYQNKQ